MRNSMEKVIDYPKMLWLGENNMHDKAIFIRNSNQFDYLIDKLTHELFVLKQFD